MHNKFSNLPNLKIQENLGLPEGIGAIPKLSAHLWPRCSRYSVKYKETLKTTVLIAVAVFP